MLTSTDIGLPTGGLEDVDARVAILDREQLILRIVWVLTGLTADREAFGRTVSLSLAGELGPTHPVSIALASDATAVFIEPLQQLLLLRRALTLEPNGTVEVSSNAGLDAYIEACRFATDVCSVNAEDFQAATSDAEASTHAAANLLLRASLVDPPHFLNWVARLRLMMNELPKTDSRVEALARSLRERIEFSFGLTFDEVTTFAGMMGLWSLRFTNLNDVFKQGAALALNLDSWSTQTTLDTVRLSRFFDRTVVETRDSLSDSSLGGPTSVLPFRDRPFVRFLDGSIAPISPALVLEKATYDVFWWSGSPDKKQQRPWQRDWGDLVEAYVVNLLEWIARETGCGFRADVRWQGKQVDAAMWFKGHVAVFEVSAAMLTDTAAHGGRGDQLASALRQTLLRSTSSSGKEKDEAIAQVARDAKALLRGELRSEIPVDTIECVYPVVIALDRRVRTPPLRFWFDAAFAGELGELEERSRVSSLAVWGLEDLEIVEQLVRERASCLKGTPRGALRLLRNWALLRDRLPGTNRRAGAWHHLVGHTIPVPTVNERLKAESDCWWTEVRELLRTAPPSTEADSSQP